MSGDARLRVRTVAGDLVPEALGPTLMHEHLVIDMRPEWEQTGPQELDDGLVDAILPSLQAAREAGARALVECTRPGNGQRLDVYRQAGARAGVAVVAAVGWYRDGWLAPWVRATPPQALAAWLLAGLRERGCGLIKVGCDPDGPSPDEAKCVRAAALASRETGALVMCHVGWAAPAHRVLDVFESAGGDPQRLVVAHVQNEPEFAAHLALARRGAWIEYDHIGRWVWAHHAQLSPAHRGTDPDDSTCARWILEIAAAGLVDRLLLGQDTAPYLKNEQGVVSRRPPERLAYLFGTFLPALRTAGASEALVEQVVVANPRRALAFRP